ncbi:MAG: Amidohydrolase family [Puniceicoccaceae bacterium 5H]|nr:MAG: Amidohydrolase family [Puniceicoccaceae bacterium 5H]
MRIIDIHTHPVFFGDGAQREQVDKLVRYARSLGIERMVALGDVLYHGPTPTPEQMAEINDTTHQLMQWYPHFFIGFCGLNPLWGEPPVRAELERCVAHGFRGIKLEISNNARDRVMKPLMKAAEDFGVPVLQHTWDTKGKAMRQQHSDSSDTALLARRHPNVKVIMAHLYGIGVRGILEAKHLPNLYIDTSSCLPVAGLVECAIEQLGDDRLLYGSDLPIRELGQCIGRVSGAAISEAAKHKVLFQNACELLGGI